MNDPYEDTDFGMNFRERKHAKALARRWAARAMEERKREGEVVQGRAESAEEAREWARTLIFVALGAVVLAVCVWLGSAF